MLLFQRKPVLDEYDREALLASASRAETKGDRKRAREEYERVLRWEPDNWGLHVKVAALVALLEPGPAAWAHFRAAAEGHVRDSFVEKGAAVYRQAVPYYAGNVELWLALARCYVALSRRADAVKVLLEGRTHFPKLAQHQQATQLLRRAVEVEPWHPEATLALARLRRTVGDRAEALHLLAGLAARTRGVTLRRVRALQFRMRPTPAAAWRWLKAALAR